MNNPTAQLDLFGTAPAVDPSAADLAAVASLRMAGTFGACLEAGATCGNCRHKRESARIQQRVFYRCGHAFPNYEPGKDIGNTWPGCEYWERGVPA